MKCEPENGGIARTEHNALQCFNAIVGSPVDRFFAPLSEFFTEITMYFLGLGIVLLALKYLEIGPVAAWDWWVVFIPFGLAVAWWAWADSTGYTKRKAMEREDARRQARVDKNKIAIGTLQKKKR